MRVDPQTPPRLFTVKGVTLRHAADVALEPGEIVTFTTEAGAQYDVARTGWGFYATPSLNRRLVSFGLRAVLVRAGDGAAFIMLVEAGHETAFADYCAAQGSVAVCWLDTDAVLDRIGREATATKCALCEGALEFLARFDERPPGETDFGLSPYRRELWRCRVCGHVINRHDMDMSNLYGGQYWDSTYGDRVRATFDRIMALPPQRSDNRGRVARIVAYWQAAGVAAPRTLLDVGSGMAVFPAVMRAEGWRCTALDPDPSAARHATDVAGVEGIAGDLFSLPPERRFGLVTLNKVLEHVPDMAGLLARSRSALASGGVIYVEVPDAEEAARDSLAREEFFIEHLCAFSTVSLALLCRQAGLRLDLSERVREPSGKYTLRAFLRDES